MSQLPGWLTGKLINRINQKNWSTPQRINPQTPGRLSGNLLTCIHAPNQPNQPNKPNKPKEPNQPNKPNKPNKPNQPKTLGPDPT